ncbi:Ran-binding domain [Fragilaria crotonensis]|nr:Ran-binding domain [Fragilaria crotonensis]
MSEVEETTENPTTEEGAEDEPVKEEESTATFEPVVKLEEVEVKSGEEDEEVVIGLRAKLFIFGETLLDKGSGKKSWKERGIGEIRILRHREHQGLRVLMRQEKTMKVIVNHALDPRIALEPNAGSDRSWVWSAFDFAEGVLTETVFAIRFADSDIANQFKEKFIECQKEMETLLAGEDKPSADGGAAADDAAAALAGLKTNDDADADDDDDSVDV